MLYSLVDSSSQPSCSDSQSARTVSAMSSIISFRDSSIGVLLRFKVAAKIVLVYIPAVARSVMTCYRSGFSINHCQCRWICAVLAPPTPSNRRRGAAVPVQNRFIFRSVRTSVCPTVVLFARNSKQRSPNRTYLLYLRFSTTSPARQYNPLPRALFLRLPISQQCAAFKVGHNLHPHARVPSE